MIGTRRGRRGWVLWGSRLLLAVLLGTPTVAFAECPPARAPWLRVAFDGDAFAAPLRALVLEQLEADLGPRGVVTCVAPVEGAPLGDVQLTLARPAALSIDLRDDVTHKRVSRTLSLDGVPKDALALSIALVAEELLHASWIEAALAPPPAPAPSPVPLPVPRVVAETNDVVVAQVPRPSTTHVAFVGAADHATGGHTAFGADLRVAWGGRATIGVRAGARAAPDTASAHGSIRDRELLVGVAGSYALVPREARAGGEVLVRADALDVQLSGVASPGAQASSGSALAMVAGGGLGGWLCLGGVWRAVAEGALGAPVHGVTASDAGRTTGGLTGVIVGVSLGVGAEL